MIELRYPPVVKWKETRSQDFQTFSRRRIYSWIKESYDKRTLPEKWAPGLISSPGGIPDPGIYKCDCGWQLLGTVMGVLMSEGKKRKKNNVKECPAVFFVPCSRRVLFYSDPTTTVDAMISSLWFCPRRNARWSACSRVGNYYPPYMYRLLCQKQFNPTMPESSW